MQQSHQAAYQPSSQSCKNQPKDDDRDKDGDKDKDGEKDNDSDKDKTTLKRHSWQNHPFRVAKKDKTLTKTMTVTKTKTLTKKMTVTKTKPL